MSEPSFQDLRVDDFVLESLPDEVLASMERRDRELADLPYVDVGLESLVADVQAWHPGQRIRVAFLGGSTELHAAIESATREITEIANIILDFRGNDGTFRTWSIADTEYAAEIRIAFDQAGYFSLVGTDSIDPRIGLPHQPVGGAPHQRTLNLGGFHLSLPNGWEGTVRHEFLHALSFHHEHQNMRGPCEAAFRWDDDPDYRPTRDTRGAYVVDPDGRRPGIYTYLSGYPNGWPRSKVDHNLRTPADGRSLMAGPFDPASVMLYRFPPLFYRAHPSPCAPAGDGQHLSDGDKRALRLLYPAAQTQVDAIELRRERLADLLDPVESDPDEGLESGLQRGSTFARELASRLRRERNAISHTITAPRNGAT